MSDYHVPLRDIRFVLEHVTPLAQLSRFDDFAHADAATVTSLLQEAARFAAEVIAPTDRPGDLEGARLRDGVVTTPASFKDAYRRFAEAGWGALPHPTGFGGGGFPLLVANAVKEMISSANMAFSLGPLLTAGAVHLLDECGSEQQQRTFLPSMVAGKWSATMDLTEPQAGSDLGEVATRALAHENGSYRLFGQKIFITYGDHDLTDNIVHLVLARLDDAPAGTRGLSLFVVPKFLVADDGALGERNDVRVLGLEHKLGIHGTPTCVMAFGDGGSGAVGELVGPPHSGMAAMFTMMNDARLGVGIQGLAVAERAYQKALNFASQRRQGRAPTVPDDGPAPIVEHADVRRMLLTMKASIEAVRGVCYATAHALDMARHHPEPSVRNEHQALADLLTPVAKSWGTDLGVESASLAIQVHGGMGYIEETGVAQHLRDIRIGPIYEGTNGIQAIDLVMRKIVRDHGSFVLDLIARMQDHAAEMPEELHDIARGLTTATGSLERATAWLLDHRDAPNELLAGASPYLRLFGTVYGGWQLAKGAQAAARLLAEGRTANFGSDFLAARLTVARFYATQILPQSHGLEAMVTAGSADLYGVSPEQLGL